MTDKTPACSGPVPTGFTVLIIDDHELFSTSLRMTLRGHGLDTHQAAMSGIDQILLGARALPAGLVVLDLDLGKDAEGRWVHGADLVAALRSDGWKVLVVSGSADQPGIAGAIASGAIGAVSKSSSFEMLLGTVLKAAAGEPVMTEAEHHEWLTRHRGYQAQKRELSRRMSRLSRREREVLELLAEGHRAAVIATRFMVSMTTVRTQIRSILVKLEVSSQLEAVALIRPAPSKRLS